MIMIMIVYEPALETRHPILEESPPLKNRNLSRHQGKLSRHTPSSTACSMI
jgi:hypothetical protein